MGASGARRAAQGPCSRAGSSPTGPTASASTLGRERGEALDVERDASGRISRMYLATYAVTREPLAFAEL
jgi:hypothetical protein